jgi:ribosomal protein L28
MARVCELCGKGSMKGNLVPRGIGRRVTKRTIRRQHPNLRTVRMAVNGDNKATLKLCASCVKRMKKDKKAQEESKSK